MPTVSSRALLPALLAATLASALACSGKVGDSARTAGGEVNVYSHRHYEADRELFGRFTEQTGIEVNVVTASADELITRLENEGADSPADILITVDAGRLHRARTRQLLQPVTSAVLEASIPAALRDDDDHWFGITQRARILVYHKDRVRPDELSTYAALAEPQWKGRVLIRSSSNVYNQSLLASVIAHDGAGAAERWAAGVVGSLARQPSGGDTDQIKAVAAGVGDVAVVNSYYLARLATSDDAEERRVAEQVVPFFPNQAGRGTHVNVSGAGVTRHAKNRDNAVRLLEFLTSDAAQALLMESNGEYPVKAGVPWSATLEGWGRFKADTLALTRLGELNDEAVRIADRAQWR